MPPTASGTGALVHLWFGTLTLLAVIAYVLTDGVGRGATLTLASSAVAVRLGVLLRRGRLTPRPPWLLTVAGVGLLSLGNLGWLIEVDIGGAVAPSNPLVLLALPLGYLGPLVASVLLVMPAARRDAGGVLDALTVGIAGAIVLWLVLVDPALAAAGATTAARLYDLVVLLIVSGMVGALTRAAWTSPRVRPVLGYLLASALLVVAGTVLRIVTADPTTGRPADWSGAVWVIAALAIGAAGTHPSSRHPGEAGRPWEGRLTNRRVVLLGVALGLGPAVAAAREISGHPADWVMLSASLLVLIPVVMMRFAQLGRLHADAERRFAHLANHDALTGLANRRAIDAHLEELVARADRDGFPGAVVLLCDLDRFKDVNDAAGHHAGDELLAVVAERLRRCVRSDGTDFVGRLGGDEFLLVLEGDVGSLTTGAVERVSAALRHRAVVGGHPVELTASIGVATLEPGERTTADRLLSVADNRMYQRKRAEPASD